MSFSSNSDCLDNEQIKCMVDKVLTLLGGNHNELPLSNKDWCNLLSISIDEYLSAMHNQLIKNQWTALANQNISTTDICTALTQRSHDFAFQFAQAYSKQVGLQSRGDYELKKDYIDLKVGQSIYEIESGREINQVIWMTFNTNKLALNNTLGGGYNNTGYSNWLSDGANSPYYIAPAYDIVLRSQDINIKKQLLGNDKPYYKITATSDGKKLLHLFNYTGNCGGCGGCSSCNKKEKCRIWYHYYDTNTMDEETANKCKSECKDIIKFPYEVKSEDVDFCELNETSKVWIRKYLTALAKETIGKLWGKFGGDLKVGGVDLKINYESFENQGIEEKNSLTLELKEYVESFSNSKILEDAANDADNLNRILKHYPDCIFSF